MQSTHVCLQGVAARMAYGWAAVGSHNLYGIYIIYRIIGLGKTVALVEIAQMKGSLLDSNGIMRMVVGHQSSQG